MSDIPNARRLVAEVRATLEGRDPVAAAKLARAEQLMRREAAAKPRASPSSAKVDAKRAAEIRNYVRHHPRKSEIEIARVFSTNPGRVSEALHGKR